MEKLIIYKNIQKYCAEIGKSYRYYLHKINELGTGFLILTEDKIFSSIITDGDLRRHMLQGKTLESIADWEGKKSCYSYITDGYDNSREILDRSDLRILPILSSSKEVMMLMTDRKLPSDTTGFIMAGGKGTRLKPLTDKLPKPLVKVAGKELIRYPISYLKKAGVEKIEISVNHMRQQIVDFIKNIQKNEEIELVCVVEKQPLGTAGSLWLSKFQNSGQLVCNADIITDFDLDKLVWAAMEHELDLVVACRKEVFSVPFGVIDTAISDENLIVGISEKPSFNFDVATGIYFFPAGVHDVTSGLTELNMPELINIYLEKGLKVGKVAFEGSWLDVGRIDQLEKARHLYG